MAGVRKHPRIHALFSVDVRLEDTAATLMTLSLNISREGLFLVTNEPPAVGTHVHLQVHDQATDADLDGVVVRASREEDMWEPPGMAVLVTQADAAWARICDRVEQSVGS